ncbi:MAG: M48 family metallopeptidase [Carbonactinosporaceae bacterium]
MIEAAAGRGPPRVTLLLAIAFSGAAFVAVLVLTTPWQALPALPALPGGTGGTGGTVSVDPSRDFTAAELAREDGFHGAIRPPAYLALAMALLVPVVLGLTPLGARLVSRAARPLGGGWAWQVLLGGLAVALAVQLATLPFGAWQERVLRDYGLSTQNWPAWWADQAKAFGLDTGLLLLVLIVLYALLRALPRMWWLPAALGGGAIVLVVSFVYPLVVEPVFNDFQPMRHGALRSSLLRLADRDGVLVQGVLVADASRRTTTLNAYVSGYGPTRRIVVYDTTLRSARPREIRQVVAHELGHSARGDVVSGTVTGALGVVAGTCLLALVLTGRPVLRRAGVERLSDPRSLALVLALVTVAATLSGPLQAVVSRRVEAAADVHALDLTRDPVGHARVMRELAVANLADLDPDPLAYAIFASHPTGPERIAIAREWARLQGLPEPSGVRPESR